MFDFDALLAEEKEDVPAWTWYQPDNSEPVEEAPDGNE